MTPVELERLAELVVERLVSELSPLTAAALLDADEVARRLAVERDYVYRNARRLGARRLGDGGRPRLRFLWADVLEALPCSASKGSPAGETRIRASSRPRQWASSVPLVPIRGASVPKPHLEETS